MRIAGLSAAVEKVTDSMMLSGVGKSKRNFKNKKQKNVLSRKYGKLLI